MDNESKKGKQKKAESVTIGVESIKASEMMS